MAEIAGDLSTERPCCLAVTWQLRDFFRRPAIVNSRLKSTPFPLANSDWRIVLQPNGSLLNDTEGYIDIFLRREDFSVARQRVIATFSLKNRKGKNCESYSVYNLYEQNEDSWGVTKFIERSQLKKKKHILLPRGTLTIYCYIIVEPSFGDSGAPEDESSGIDSPLERVQTGDLPCQHLEASSQTETPDACKGAGDLLRTSASVQKLQTDFKKLLDCKEDSDVCLKVSDKEFKAHKCILRARSSVFSAMFTHDTTEKTSGKVVIEDLDPESFPDFLQHIYSGKVDELSEENVFNLFIAADKYDLTDLRSECKDYMKSTLSVDTFCDVMIVALRYREDDLLKLAIDFFTKNLKKIIVTVKWQKFLKEYDTEANELFIKALITNDEE